MENLSRKTRLAHFLVLSLCVVLIAMHTRLASATAAQNATSYRVDSNTNNGLYVTNFTTPQGLIRVNLPDDMVVGDTVSGSIYTEPTGKNETDRSQNLEDLNGYMIDLGGQETAVGDRAFTRIIKGAITIVLLLHGRSVATATIPIAVTAPPRPTQFTVPTGGQQGRLLQINCPCNGVFSAQDYVKVGGTALPLIAESPRKLVVHNTSEVTGPTNMDVAENGSAVQCPFRNIAVNLSAAKLNLIRGETTTVHVMVVGLGGMSGDQSLDLLNTSPGVIKMSGGEQQHLTIHGADVKPGGTYSIDRTLTGVTAGGFNVTATLRWTDACNQPARPQPPPAESGSARTKLERGRNLLAHFKFYAALDPLTEALKSYTKRGDQNGIGVTSDALGDLYQEEGQYVVALRYFEDARRAFLANKETLNASLVLSKIGETHLIMDDNAGAKAVFAQFTQASNPPSDAVIIKASFSATPADTDQHKAFFAYARNKLGEGRADYLSGQTNAADADFKELLAASSLPQNVRYKEAARFRAAAATNLGDVLFRKGDLTAARDRYNEAIQVARRDRRTDLEWAAKAGLGRTLWKLSQGPQQQTARLQTDAINAYREALADIETIVEGSIRAHEARTTFLTATSQVFDEAAAVNAEIALAKKETGPTATTAALPFTAESFRISEAGRARSLLDVLADGHAEISAGVPPELVKRRSENLANQQLIGAQLTGVSIAGETPTQSVLELEAELERLAVEFESIESQIRSSSPRYSGLVHTRSLTLDEVQRQVLDDDTALLEYSLGDESSYLWVITRQSANLFKLPAGASVNQLAMDFRAQLIPPKLQRRNVGIDVATGEPQRGLGLSTGPPAENTAAFSRAANALYKAAVAPAMSVIGNRRLVIVADGALNFVPFEALVTTDKVGDYSSLDYLIKTNKTSYAPSASVTAAIRDQKRTAGRNVLLIADPIFSANDPRLRSSSAGAGKQNEATRGLGLDSAVSDVTGPANPPNDPLTLPRLAGTRAEAEQIARLTRNSGAQADMWLDLAANEDDVKTREIQSYRVLHVATHGILDATRPQFSGLVLSLVGNKNDDGFLRTSEVFNLKLGAPLVMLSACESGLGKIKRGEGVIGLTQAFMYAGAPTVGVTLWSVADKPTAELMTDFYRHMLGPEPSPSSAMREAQLTMISGKKYSAPFYWAPFVLVGEWK
ncbi:MAG TPA: CHAT domain-containing tetratricopeptide repeat protein [Pyrinomonadaceae bacterium]|jgi:CHAT domain-containing protein/tetratricopeptide (TPR) repeat protein|nr:CHAT domain-containing tetratricopeptide repeat protein [Pyrinomonadaceae bacterium]